MTKYPQTLPVLPPLDIKGSWIRPLRVCELYCHDSKKFCKSDTSHWNSSPVVLAPQTACLSFSSFTSHSCLKLPDFTC